MAGMQWPWFARFMKRKLNNLYLVSIVLAVNILLDRMTKYLAVEFLKDRPNIGILFDSIVLGYVENTGAFLGLGSDWNIHVKYVFLIIVPMIICVVVIIFSIFKSVDKKKLILVITVAAGGLSNLIDRLFNSFAVIDFLNFGIGNLRTGVLNMADLSVTFGAALFVMVEFRNRKD